MLKQNITWEGFDGRTKNRTLYFNLTRFEISHDMELEVLEERFIRFRDDVIGEEIDRKMTPPEIREMLDIIQTIVKHAYGYRSTDGERFTKNEEVWNEFVETGAFDAFIWYLFEDPNRANAFMSGIWPKEIQQAAEKEAQKSKMHVVQPEETVPVAPDDGIPSIESHSSATEDVKGDPEKDWYEYTEEDLLGMTHDEYNAVVKKAQNGGKNTPPHLLVIGQKRKQATVEQGGQTE